MPIRSVFSDKDGTVIDLGGGPLEIRHQSFPGLVGSDNHRKAFLDGINALIETRINVDDLPIDEEVLTPSQWSDARMTTVYGGSMFFDKVGPNTFLVSRGVIVSAAVWNGEKYSLTIMKSN